MPFVPAWVLWLKASGWSGERSRRSSGRMYISTMAATRAPTTQIRPPIIHDVFMRFTRERPRNGGWDKARSAAIMIAVINLLSILHGAFLLIGSAPLFPHFLPQPGVDLPSQEDHESADVHPGH